MCVNSLVCSILYRRSPDEVKLLMVDPKIVELKFFNDIPHLLAPVITDPKKALQAVQWCLYEMERRYALLDAIGAKDIRSYNAKVEKRHIATNKLPYIVLVIDEFADLMATSGKDLEGNIARLAAMSRAVGIHLVLATQRPSVDVITGLIKANFSQPHRVHGGVQDRQPHHHRPDGRRKTARPRRHAVHLELEPLPQPHPGRVLERGRRRARGHAREDPGRARIHHRRDFL